MTGRPLTQPGDARRWDRSSWIAFSIVLLMIVASIVAAIASLARVGDGCVYDSGSDTPTIGACVGGWDTPLRAGDKLVAVGDMNWQNVDSLTHPVRPSGWVENGTIPYTVQRGERTLGFDVPLHYMGRDAILRAFGYGLVRQATDWNLSAFLGAIVIFALVPRARAAQLLLVAIGGLTAVTMLKWPGDNVAADFVTGPLHVLRFVLGQCWVWLFVPTILVLVLSFPRRVWPLAPRPRSTLALIYGLPLAGVAASYLTARSIFFITALGLSALCVLVATIVITAHTFLRVSDPVVRAQTAWMALGLVVGLIFWPALWLLFITIPGLSDALNRLSPPWWLALPIAAVPTLGLPICLGIAITRYRLFDIDIIIRRTLVYSALTITLGLVYLGCILLGRTLVAPLTGGSELAIVASTLLIAALFFPLRRRIQNLIDRRFYRRKYNAQQVLAQFALTARDETDLQVLTDELGRVVNETMQPEFVSVWLREPASERLKGIL